MPCKQGFFNQDEKGFCEECPPFTSSRRHEEDPTYLEVGSEKKADVTAATHCVLDDELHIRESGQIYKAAHFKARGLCSSEMYL
mmetsp:Transcript_10833/g.13647  ORF Transcript_10833/g.13647 Transcript_10833/m.13647 type:complete len:84 (+) Transcript_10833:2072-2323(+)